MVYTPSKPNRIYRLLIALDGISPPVWRLVDVQATLSLSWLHDVIQWAMGWEHRHRYFFYRGEFSYVEQPVVHEWSVGKELAASHYSLEKVFGHRGRYVEYVYDMVDTWHHHIWLEDEFTARPRVAYPRIIDGARACPPEGFGGAEAYQRFLDGELDLGQEGLEALDDFDPDAFEPVSRSFPNARVLVEDGEARAEVEVGEFDTQAAEMLGPLFSRVEALLRRVDPNFARDLRRALEDLVLTEDTLPPLCAETLEEARQEDIGIEDFLIDVIRNYRDLGEAYSFAPIHAADIVSHWPTPKAIDAFLTVLCQAPDDEEGTINTMIDALTHTGEGTERLLAALDDLEENRRMQALNTLVHLGVHDERVYSHLREAMKKASPRNPTAPYILSYYDDPRAIELLNQAAEEAIEPLGGDLSEESEEALAEQADYALFLAEMLTEAGGELDEKHRKTLAEIEAFFWSSAELEPGFAGP